MRRKEAQGSPNRQSRKNNGDAGLLFLVGEDCANGEKQGGDEGDPIERRKKEKVSETGWIIPPKRREDSGTRKGEHRERKVIEVVSRPRKKDHANRSSPQEEERGGKDKRIDIT